MIDVFMPEFDPVISIVPDDCYNTCFIIVLFW